MFPGDSRGTRGGGRVKEGAGEARREREGRWRGGGGGAEDVHRGLERYKRVLEKRERKGREDGGGGAEDVHRGLERYKRGRVLEK